MGMNESPTNLGFFGNNNPRYQNLMKKTYLEEKVELWRHYQELKCK